MKDVYRYFKIVAILLSIINCKTKTTKPIFENNSEQLKRIWMLVEFKNFKKEDLIKNEAQFNLTNFNNASAKMGCNQIGFGIEIKKDKIKFLNLMQTEMYCENKMKLEDAFSKSLLEIYSYNIIGQKLFLTNSKKEKMIFIAQDWDWFDYYFLKLKLIFDIEIEIEFVNLLFITFKIVKWVHLT